MKKENREIQAEQRELYMEGKLTHAEYYLWLADFIGATPGMLPVSLERIKASSDPHLNDITLSMWDHKDPLVRHLANMKKLPWSLSDTVCVLKAIARREAHQEAR